MIEDSLIECSWCGKTYDTEKTEDRPKCGHNEEDNIEEDDHEFDAYSGNI